MYAVGHTKLTPQGYLMAAVLALGPGAVLSHVSAASHHGLRRTNQAKVDGLQAKLKDANNALFRATTKTRNFPQRWPRIG